MQQNRWRSQLGFTSTRHFDSDEAAESTPGADFEFSLTRRGHPGAWHVRQAGLGEARLAQGTWPAPLVASGPVQADTIATCFGIRGDDRFKLNGQPVRRGVVMVSTPESELVISGEAASRWSSFQMSRGAFEREWRLYTGTDWIPEGPRAFNADPAHEARLCRAMQAALGFAEAEPGRLLDSTVGMRLQRQVLRVLLQCIAGAPQSTPVHRSVIRRAAEFLHEHRDQVIDQTDLCRALSVNDRALRRLFADVYGTSPGRYLRVRRLHQARRSLRSAWPATVTGAAVTFGFFDLGRFAADYHAHFGELPSQTLAARRHAA